jgi:site-specific recombinase XerD
VTKADIVAWKDLLVADGYAPKGIRDGQLSAAKTLFKYAVDNDLLSTNPGAEVKLLVKRKAGSGRLPTATTRSPISSPWPTARRSHTSAGYLGSWR